MELPSCLVLYVSLLVGLSCCFSRIRMTCPAVHEGRSVTLNCASDADSSDGRWIFWSKRRRPGDNYGDRWKQIALCDNGGPCEVHSKSSYRASVTENTGSFETSLKIRRSNPKHREAEFQCAIVDYEKLSDDTSNQGHCKLHVYRLPKQPRCEVVEVTRHGGSRDVKDVTVRCGPETVYPGMVCSLREKWSNAEGIYSKHVMFVYDRQKIKMKGREYTNETCTATFQLSFPGSYQFSVQIRPALHRYLLGGQHFPEFNFSKSIDIPVSLSEQRVKVHKEFTCFENNMYRFVCYSSGFPSKPSIRWFVNTVEVNPGSAKVACKNEICVSEFVANISHVGMDISCQAEIGRIQMLDTVDFTLPWSFASSPGVMFLDDRSVALSKTTRIARGDRSFYMECIAANLAVEISSLCVVCRQGDEIILHEEKEVNEYLPTLKVLFRPSNSTICKCWAKLENLCYTDTTTVYFHSDLNPISPFTIEDTTKEDESSVSLKTFLIVTFVLVICLVLGLFLAVALLPSIQRACFGNSASGYEMAIAPPGDGSQTSIDHGQSGDHFYDLGPELDGQSSQPHAPSTDVSVHRASSMRSENHAPEEETAVKQVTSGTTRPQACTLTRDWSVHQRSNTCGNRRASSRPPPASPLVSTAASGNSTAQTNQTGPTQVSSSTPTSASLSPQTSNSETASSGQELNTLDDERCMDSNQNQTHQPMLRIITEGHE